MRNQVLTAIRSASLQAVNISSELPFTDSGTSVYTRNPKTLYVGETNSTTEPLLETLDGTSISNTTTSVTVYFTTDAKNVQPWYETNIDTLKGLLPDIDMPGSTARDVQLTTEFEGDLLLTEIEYRITKLT